MVEFSNYPPWRTWEFVHDLALRLTSPTREDGYRSIQEAIDQINRLLSLRLVCRLWHETLDTNFISLSPPRPLTPRFPSLKFLNVELGQVPVVFSPRPSFGGGFGRGGGQRGGITWGDRSPSPPPLNWKKDLLKFSQRPGLETRPCFQLIECLPDDPYFLSTLPDAAWRMAHAEVSSEFGRLLKCLHEKLAAFLVWRGRHGLFLELAAPNQHTPHGMSRHYFYMAFRQNNVPLVKAFLATGRISRLARKRYLLKSLRHPVSFERAHSQEMFEALAETLGPGLVARMLITGDERDSPHWPPLAWRSRKAITHILDHWDIIRLPSLDVDPPESRYDEKHFSESRWKSFAPVGRGFTQHWHWTHRLFRWLAWHLLGLLLTDSPPFVCRDLPLENSSHPDVLLATRFAQRFWSGLSERPLVHSLWMIQFFRLTSPYLPVRSARSINTAVLNWWNFHLEHQGASFEVRSQIESHFSDMLLTQFPDEDDEEDQEEIQNSLDLEWITKDRSHQPCLWEEHFNALARNRKRCSDSQRFLDLCVLENNHFNAAHVTQHRHRLAEHSVHHNHQPIARRLLRQAKSCRDFRMLRILRHSPFLPPRPEESDSEEEMSDDVDLIAPSDPTPFFQLFVH